MIGIQYVFWHSPFGDVIDLFSKNQSGIRYKILVDEEGMFSPTLSFGSFKVSQQGGEVLNFSRVGRRTIVLPVIVQGDNAEEMRQGIETLMRAFRPSADMDGKPESGKIVYHFPTKSRYLNCVFAGGLEKMIQRGELYALFNLQFVAHDPFWYADEEIETMYLFNASFTPWFPWQYPWRTSVAGIHADVLIQLNESWQVAPVFEISGPVQEIVLENITSNIQFKVNYGIQKDEVMYVDMQEKTISLADGTNLWKFTEGEMWGFLPGENRMVMQLSDATQESEVVLRYRERFFAL